MILYVRKNEETSYLKIIHFFEEEKGVPSELEANAKSKCDHHSRFLFANLGVAFSVLDEAFPEVTIDLVSYPFSTGTAVPFLFSIEL